MDNLNEYLDYFKGLSLKEKQEIIIDELKLLSATTNKMCEEIGASNEILLSKELSNINDDNYNEAIITYICSIKNSLSDFNIKLTDISNNIE